MFRRDVLPWLVYFLYRAWTATWRIECIESPGFKRDRENGERIVFAHWHGDELCVVPLVTRYKIATMTSTSKDGQLIDFTIRKLGGATSRGSSTRGAVGALKGLIRLIREGYRASMAVDGPKGPFHKVKPGVFELSRLAGAKIVATGTACSRAIVFEKSWNKAKLPKPFSRVVVVFAEPWAPISKEDDVKSPEMAARLSDELSKACQRAAEHLR
jgi:lysophospholipid acyltransferase (LPLAT)-like uncharacterized protein